MLDAAAHDIRYAVRALRGSPGFAAAAILSLALGLGANTAIFSLISAVMLRPLPVSHPEQLVELTGAGTRFYSNPAWEQIRGHQDVFSSAFAYGLWRFNLAAGGPARRVNGDFVSGRFFETLGVKPALGRVFTAADDFRGCPGGAVLSYSFWQREYGGRPDVLGRTISIDTHPLPIAGVAERAFTGFDVGMSVDVMVPLCAESILHVHGASMLDQPDAPWLRVVGRLNPRVSAARAEARLNTLAPELLRDTVPRQWSAEQQQRYLRQAFEVLSAAQGISFLRRQYRQALLVLMGIVGLVLAIASANVANLLLARGAARRREIAIRVALGCGRARLIRQFLTESLLLAGLGALLGTLFAAWGTRLLVAFLDVHLDLTPDGRVLSFTASVAVLSALAFGILPAWRGTGVSPQGPMQANARGMIEGGRFGLGKALVVLEVALSLLLVAGAGLLLGTFWKLATIHPGFDAGRVLLVRLDLRNSRSAPVRAMLDRVRALPGVRSASISDHAPISELRWIEPVRVEGSGAGADVFFNRVGEGYLETMGTALVAGRDFNRTDTPSSPSVAIINQTMARRFFGTANPLGRRFRSRRGNRVGPPVEIVGVARDAKYGSLREEIPPEAYLAWGQDAEPGPFPTLEVRAAEGAPSALIAPAQDAIVAVAPAASLEFTTMASQVRQSIERETLLAWISGIFGALALLLATVGLYGTMSYTVVRRRNEIGIRVALGAGQGRVLRMVMADVARVVGAGMILGLAAAAGATRLLANFLYGVTPTDPAILAGAAAVLGAVAALAGYLPARRASRLDPMSALREE